MRSGAQLRRVAVLALLGAAMSAGGCVLVVGDSGRSGRGDVEWSTGSERAVTTEVRTVDGGLLSEVESRLRMDSTLAREDITVSSSGGVITLHGRVSDIAVLEHAMRVVAEVPGVARVVSRLTVEMEAS
jgi:osmotically-inducible protein OsmY